MITNYPIVERTAEPRYDTKDLSVLCFAGGITPQWNHDRVIQAIERIDGVRYLLFGDGFPEYLDYLRGLPGWKRVDYRGRVSHDEVRNGYRKAFIGIALNSCTQLGDEGTLGNTKLFEYMEAGLPIICSNYRLWRELVERHKCGICVDPSKVEQITEAIRYLLENPERAKEMGLNGRKAVLEHYNWDQQAKCLLDLYASL